MDKGDLRFFGQRNLVQVRQGPLWYSRQERDQIIRYGHALRYERHRRQRR